MKRCVICVALGFLIVSCHLSTDQSINDDTLVMKPVNISAKVMIQNGHINLYDPLNGTSIDSPELIELIELIQEKHPAETIVYFECEQDLNGQAKYLVPTHIWSIESESDLGFHWHHVDMGIGGTEVYQCHRYRITYFCPIHNHTKKAISHTFN